MSPQTGAVYAMSSFPSYDPSVWVGGISQPDYAALTDPTNNEPLLNRAIDGLYTPGSTFKLNTATAALQSGLWHAVADVLRQRHLQDAGLPVQQHDLRVPQQLGQRVRAATTCRRR